MSNYDVGIVDGQNIFYKAFSIHKDFYVKVDGQRIYTGGTFGFVNSLILLKRDYLSDTGQILVAWDRGHERRSQIYPEYKANRNKDEWEEKDNFETQRRLLQDVLKLIGVPQIYKKGEEADDIIGTLSHKRAKNNQRVVIMSADKDFQQLIQRNVDLLAHKSKDNIKLWNEQSWADEFGFHPSKFVHILSLKGDPGDNIPGVQGIGDKNAYKIVSENYDLLDAINNYNSHLPLMPPNPSAALRKLVSDEGKEMYRLSYKLALIDKYIQGLKILKGQKDMNKLEDLFEMLQFNYLLQPSNWSLLGGM